MTQKEMRKLKRAELQDLVAEQNMIIEKLQFRVEELEERLADRSIKIEQAGSLADAAVQVSGVMEAAQRAAQQYLDNVKVLSERQQAICTQQEEECKARCHSYEARIKQRCAELESTTKQRCAELETTTKQKCAELEKTTEQKVSARWTEFSQKVDQCLEAHGELKEILKLTAAVTETK